MADKKRKERLTGNRLQNGTMSLKTKEFLQKICYKKTASIDMTIYGFVSDSKLHPVRLYIKPLALQLEKICGKPNKNLVLRKQTHMQKKGSKIPKPRRFQVKSKPGENDKTTKSKETRKFNIPVSKEKERRQNS